MQEKSELDVLTVAFEVSVVVSIAGIIMMRAVGLEGRCCVSVLGGPDATPIQSFLQADHPGGAYS